MDNESVRYSIHVKTQPGKISEKGLNLVSSQKVKLF